MQELLTHDLGNRITVRDNTSRGEEIVKIALDKIQVREGFNVRKDYGDIESLANSIAENGQTLPGRVDVLADGTFLLTDGHRRYNSCLLLSERGDAPLFKAIVNSQKTTEEQRILQMFTTQDNKQLLESEVADLLRRLINIGYDEKQVATRIGKTENYVNKMLAFANDSPVIRQYVDEGKLTIAKAAKLRNQIPSTNERVEKVKHAVSKGSTRLADVTGTNPKEKKAYKIAAAISDRYALDEKELQEIILPLL